MDDLNEIETLVKKNDNINKYDYSNSIIEPRYYSLRKTIERI